MGFNYWETPLSNEALDAAAVEAPHVCAFGSDVTETYFFHSATVAVTWAAAESAAVAASNQPVLNIPSGYFLRQIALTHSTWAADTGYEGDPEGWIDDQRAGFILDDAIEYTEDGTYTLTAMSLSLE